MSQNIAVILAGGVGSRLGYSKPKQFLKIAGKMVIEHTLQTFQEHPHIDGIIVVTHKNYIEETSKLVHKNGFDKVSKILNGGNERYESSLVAIEAVDDEHANIIFHDAVRPLASKRIISDCIEALQNYNAVDVAIPTADTIIKVRENIIEDIPDRSYLKRGQTPQAFKLQTIKEAYKIALFDPKFTTTDDCGVVKKYLPNEPIFVVAGEESNLKLTFKEDIFLLDKLFQLKSLCEIERMDQKLLKDKVLVVFGGSSGIGLETVKFAKEVGMKVFSFSKSDSVDITNILDVQKALQSVFEQTGVINFVINTAGILYKKSLPCMDYDTIFNTIDTNYKGSVIVAKESYQFLKQSKGSLIFFASSSYTLGRAFYSIYSSSKAAIVNLTQALADEWSEDGVRVNCINPERTLTPMRTKNFGKEDPATLLDAKEVAQKTLQSLLLDISGEVVDVKRI